MARPPRYAQRQESSSRGKKTHDPPPRSHHRLPAAARPAPPPVPREQPQRERRVRRDRRPRAAPGPDRRARLRHQPRHRHQAAPAHRRRGAHFARRHRPDDGTTAAEPAAPACRARRGPTHAISGRDFCGFDPAPGRMLPQELHRSMGARHVPRAPRCRPWAMEAPTRRRSHRRSTGYSRPSGTPPARSQLPSARPKPLIEAARAERRRSARARAPAGRAAPCRGAVAPRALSRPSRPWRAAPSTPDPRSCEPSPSRRSAGSPSGDSRRPT